MLALTAPYSPPILRVGVGDMVVEDKPEVNKRRRDRQLTEPVPAEYDIRAKVAGHYNTAHSFVHYALFTGRLSNTSNPDLMHKSP